jgi:hypothetical protein
MTELQKLITRIRVDADTLDGIAKHLDELAERSIRNLAMIYGVWTCADGREVLFSRGCRPIWQRRGSMIERADPVEWGKALSTALVLRRPHTQP